jgi:hypothetical protein
MTNPEKTIAAEAAPTRAGDMITGRSEFIRDCGMAVNPAENHRG